ncbi:MAG: hypothetical protein BWY50_00530 [Spirochaetes bacterium ADurb.Bin315]|nr:MAG: hypothetical protein BWY50_00530 [Spirochaetes bacterium ADurb.Bin315]
MERSDDAAQGLGQASEEVGRTGVRKDAVQLHQHVGKDDVGGIPTDIREGVPGGIQRSFVVHRRLDREPHSLVVLVFPLLPHLDDLPAELVTEHDRVFIDIFGNPLMVRPLGSGFMVAHTDAVGDDLRQDFIIFDCRKLKLFNPHVVDAIQSYCSCFHRNSPNST